MLAAVSHSSRRSSWCCATAYARRPASARPQPHGPLRHSPATPAASKQRTARMCVPCRGADPASSDSGAPSGPHDMVRLNMQLEDAQRWQEDAQRMLIEAQGMLAETERKLAERKEEARNLRVQALWYGQLAKWRGAELLHLTGKLSMRGVLESIEFDRFLADDKRKRQDKWAWLLESRPQLLAGVEAAAGVKGISSASEEIAKLYPLLPSRKQVSQSIKDYAKAKKVVVIHDVSPAHSKIAECICQEFEYPYEVHNSEGQQEEDGGGGGAAGEEA
uniref:Uncharacterized protein n=1 Tax=Chlamydomonas leiostraca TaxID=1034604 RepID=A0A7S0S1Y4_9CHLO